MTSEDLYVRRMTLAFPGNLFQTEALRQRIEFVEDDILCDVDLSGNSVVCDDAVTLTLMTKLQEQLGCEKLNLSQTRIGPSAVGMLAELLRHSEVLQTLQLRKLSVPWSTIVAPLCEGVKASRGLRRLDLSDNADLSRFGGVLLEAVNFAQEIRELAISGIDFVDLSALTLQVAFQNLEVLEFGSNSCDLSEVQWSQLPKLTTLYLRQAQRLGSLNHIVDAVKLHSLDLSDTPMTEEACQNIAALLRRKDCRLAMLKLARCPLQVTWLQPFLRALVANASITESLDLMGSPLGDVPTAEWNALATRMHQVKRLQLSNCHLRSIHIEELVRSVFENEAPSMLGELDITNNLVGEAAEGADWVAELLHMPQITAFYCGNNRIQNATAIYLKLRSEREARKLIGEVCSASSRRDDKANVFTNEQLAWLNKKAYTKVACPDADSFASRS